MSQGHVLSFERSPHISHGLSSCLVITAKQTEEESLDFSLKNLEETGVLKKLESLSPDIMIWDSQTVLIDLSRTIHYHQYRIQKIHLSKKMDRGNYHQSINRYFQNMSLRIFDRDDLIWIFSEHFWKSLVLADFYKNIQKSGFYLCQDHLHNTRFQRASWKIYFSLAKTLLKQFKMIEPGSRWEPQSRKTYQLQRFVERMRLSSPAALKQASSDQMSKRYGVLWSRIWQWTFTENENPKSKKQAQQAQLSLFENIDFPWKSAPISSNPTIQNYLDHPLPCWDLMAPLIKKDLFKLNRLTNKSELAQQKLCCQLKWEIELYSKQTISFEIDFRYPLHLKQDVETLVNHIQFNYENHKELKELEEFEQIQLSVQAWKFTLTKKIFTETLEKTDLLSDNLLNCQTKSSFSNETIYKIMKLAKELPYSLEQYTTRLNFLAEKSTLKKDSHLNQGIYTQYTRTAASKKKPPTVPSTASSQQEQEKLLQSDKRPLFIYSTPRPISPDELKANYPSKKYFLERCTGNWVQHKTENHRDYFRSQQTKRKPESRQSLAWKWIFRDGNGNWWEQGSFD